MVANGRVAAGPVAARRAARWKITLEDGGPEIYVLCSAGG
jgi:hypothetical protein